MTKRLTQILILIAFVVGVPALASAATFTISPASGSFDVGKTYTVNLTVSPGASKIYTAKADLKYPAGLIEVTNFSLNGGWMSLVQPGYDLIDNTNGILIKTGGYTSGLTSASTFGTVTFMVKAVGQATFAITSDSLLLDDSNQNAFVGSPSATFTLIAPAKSIVPVTKTAVKNTVTKTVQVVASTTAQANENSSSTTNQNVAAVAASTPNNTVYWILALIICSGVFFYVGVLVGKKTKV